jgi:hypothetical protein
MDPNPSSRSGSPGDPGSHLRFQISLLRLMAQKSMAQKAMAQKAMAQKAMAQKTIAQKSAGQESAGQDQEMMSQKAGSKAGPSIQVFSDPVTELERLAAPAVR